MRLNISLSAGHNFSKGDRVVCKIAKDEWYTGTVARAGVKVKVDFDDDFDAIIDESDFKHIKLMVKAKKTKKALTDAEAKELYEVKKVAKPEPKKPFVPAKPLPPVVQRPSAPKRSNEPEKPHVPVVPVKKFVPEPPRAPAPVQLESNWQVYLVPNDYRQWSFSVKDRPTGAQKFHASRYEYLHAVDALKAAFKHIEVPVFTIHIAEQVTGNSITRSTVKDNVTKEQALEFVAKLTGASQQQIDQPVPESGDDNKPTGSAADKPYLKCGDARAFKRAVEGNDKDMLTYMHIVWKRGQELIFEGRLRPCAIRFLKEQQTQSFRRRGHWHAGRRELALSRRLFNAGEVKFLEVFLHEMSHQAVTDIDNKVDTNKGHGPYWTAWMERCGIPANRYDYTANTEYMSDEERENHERGKILKQQAMQNVGTPLPARSVAVGTPIKFYSESDKRWIRGVACGVFGTKMMVADTTEVSKYGWKTLPKGGEGWMYALDPFESVEDYTSQRWKDAIETVRKHSQLQFLRRSAARKRVSIFDIPAEDDGY